MVLPNAERLVAEAQEVDPLEARVQVLETKIKELEAVIKVWLPLKQVKRLRLKSDANS